MSETPRKPCRTHEPVLTIASGGSAMYEVCPKCRRLKRNDTEVEPRFHLPHTRWERATITNVVRGRHIPHLRWGAAR